MRDENEHSTSPALTYFKTESPLAIQSAVGTWKLWGPGETLWEHKERGKCGSRACEPAPEGWMEKKGIGTD